MKSKLILKIVVLSFAMLLSSAATSGCYSTERSERDTILSPAMAFEYDTSMTYFRNKVEGAREGALGGFGSAEAGGCGCQ